MVSIAGKVAPPEKRSLAMGLIAAAASFGQFAVVLPTMWMNKAFGWEVSLIVLSIITLLLLLLLPLLNNTNEKNNKKNSFAIELQSTLIFSLKERNYILLIMGFFVCGFHVTFIALHLPTDLMSKGISAEVAGGEVVIEKDRNNPEFYGWDNEFSFHKAYINEFEASKYVVSNGEYLEFVKEGGYENANFFSDEGKSWLAYTKAKHPRFWIVEGDKYYLREVNRIISLPLNYPVDVNFYEAEAFCKYKSSKLGYEVRLPSEDEYYRLYDYVDASKYDANIGLKQFNQCSVDKYEFNGFYDVVGNVWQWSLTPTYPFDNFETHPIYDDFTTPTFDDRHALFKGGAFVSLGNETLREARYAFRKHFYQHAGFRYVKSSNEYKTKLNDNVYETDELISQYCEFHYGKENFGVKNFCVNSVETLSEYLKDINTNKALDLGCSVGRSTFELAKTFDEVMGIDFSANFINVGVKLKKYDSLIFKEKVEGEIFRDNKISLKDFGCDEIKDKVTFMQGDACNLKDIYTGYDLIFCSNLIDRLYSPQKFLEDIPTRLNDNGLLVLLSPYTWLEEYTPKQNWLGGYIKDNKEVRTFDTLKKKLVGFELLGEHDVPFVIKETARKHQHTISHMTIWKKKA